MRRGWGGVREEYGRPFISSIRVVPLPKQPILDSSHQDVDNEPLSKAKEALRRFFQSSWQGWSTWRVRSISQSPRTQH